MGKQLPINVPFLDMSICKINCLKKSSNPLNLLLKWIALKKLNALIALKKPMYFCICIGRLTRFGRSRLGLACRSASGHWSVGELG